MIRRLAARGLAVWLAALLSAGAGGAAAGVEDADPPVAAQQVAPGVYLVPGSGGAAEAANGGRIGNAGFIVGPAGVIAIDTGTSYRHGLALLDAIHRVTAQPVRLALITHVRPEFLFGAAAFRERGIPISMHAKSAALMAARCEGCLKTLRQTLGDDEMQGTVMWKPDAEFTEPATLTLIGRPVQLLYFGHASGPGDTAVLDVQTGVLFAGGLLDAARIPDVIDSRLAGWQRALSALRTLRVSAIVPGHGPLSPPGLADDVASYLTQLEARLKTLLAAGAALSEVPEACALPEFQGWDQYATVHRRNASVVYLRLELEQMLLR